MADNGLVRYKVNKKPKSGKLPQVQLAIDSQEGPRQIYGCMPLTVTEKPIRMFMRKEFPGGSIGFVLSPLDPRRYQKDFLEKYKNKTFRDTIQVRPKHKLDPDMLLLVYRECTPHAQQEYVKGLVEGPVEDESEEVVLFLVDEMEWVSFPRYELLFAQHEVFCRESMSMMAELDGIEFFQNYEKFDEIVAGMVAKHKTDIVTVHFIFDQRKGVFKAEVTMDDGSSFNKMVLDELLKYSVVKFPNVRESFRGTVSHVLKNGTIYVQHEDSLVTYLNDWLATTGSDIDATLVDPENHVKEVKDKQPMDLEALYVAPFGEGEDRSLCRAKILLETPNGKFKVRYVDYGNTAYVAKHDLTLASKVHTYLCKIPDLCAPVHMKFVEYFTDMKNCLDYLTLSATVFDIEIRQEVTNGHRSVMLWKDGKKVNQDLIQRKRWAVLKAGAPSVSASATSKR